MKRLAILVMALLACAACLGVAEFGVGQIGPWLQSHMAERWFVYACNVLVFGLIGIEGLRRKKTAVKDDERLTPVVRRDPTTGVRQL
jgi:hypothetical protein